MKLGRAYITETGKIMYELNMKKKIVLMILVSVILLFPMVLTSSAQDRMVGVAEGDWFKYGDFDVNWSSTDPNATFPPHGRKYLEEINETEWMLISVQEVVCYDLCETIIFQIVKHFKNGTKKTEGGFVNVDTGGHNMSILAISTNLDVNDTVYTHIYSTWKINEMTVRTYPDGEREINHLNTTQKWNITRYMDSWTINGTGHAFTNYYWDRSTGIPVEYSYKEIEQVGEYLTTWSTSYRIVESNVWTVPEFPTWTSILLVLIVLTVVIAIYKRRPLKSNPLNGNSSFPFYDNQCKLTVHACIFGRYVHLS